MKVCSFCFALFRKGKIWIIFLTILQKSAIIKLLNKFHRRFKGHSLKGKFSTFAYPWENFGYNANPSIE